VTGCAAGLVGRTRGGDIGGVVIDMSMSLDGYIAAPNDNPEQGLGEDAGEGPGGRRREADRAHGREHRPAVPRRGLVDEIRIHLVNVLLGGGRRLFDQLPKRTELEQTGLSQTDGLTHLEYRVVR
jgi:riboflavin biosynthesis pyrimidine reductase